MAISALDIDPGLVEDILKRRHRFRFIISNAVEMGVGVFRWLSFPVGPQLHVTRHTLPATDVGLPPDDRIAIVVDVVVARQQVNMDEVEIFAPLGVIILPVRRE